MAKVKLTLRKHDGEDTEGYPICFYVRYRGKPYFKRTGYFSKERDWNDRVNNVRASHPKGVQLQSWFENESTRLQIRLTQYEQDGYPFNIAWGGDKELPLYSAHFETRIGELFKAKDLGNMKIYRTQLKWLRKWFGQEDISFHEMNHDKMRKLVAHCDGLGEAYYSINMRLQCFKAVWSDAVNRWPVQMSKFYYPFKGLLKGRKRARTEKRRELHQPIENIINLRDYDFKSKSLAMGRDLWMLAFYLRGVNFADIIYMRPESIKNEYWSFKRLKLDKKEVWLKVKIIPQAMEIIERHRSDKWPFVFPFVTVERNYVQEGAEVDDTPEGTRQFEAAQAIQWWRLKKISQLLEFEKSLSMVQARHSWTIIAGSLGLHDSVIDQCIGHVPQSVLGRHYAGPKPQQVLDEANEKVVDCLRQKEKP